MPAGKDIVPKPRHRQFLSADISTQQAVPLQNADFPARLAHDRRTHQGANAAPDENRIELGHGGKYEGGCRKYEGRRMLFFRTCIHPCDIPPSYFPPSPS